MDPKADINFSEDDAEATGITYSLDVETRNMHLVEGQRAALREAMVQAMGELTMKMTLLVGDPKRVRVKGYINSSVGGRRELLLPQEETSEVG